MFTEYFISEGILGGLYFNFLLKAQSALRSDQVFHGLILKSLESLQGWRCMDSLGSYA